MSAIVGFGERGGSPNAASLVVAPPASQSQEWGTPPRVWAIEDTRAGEPVSVAPAAPAPPAAPTPEPWATMVARDGDSFNSLAEWFGITSDSIAAVNGVGLDHIFHPGDTLTIPIPASQFLMPPELPVYVYEEPVIEEEPVYVEPLVESTPEPTAPPPPPPAARTASQADVIAAICSLPWNCDKMVRIASCESGLNPNAYNPAGYYGIFQISGEFPGWNDPWVNAQVAYERKYLPALAGGGDGLSPWPHCRYY